MHGKDKGLQDYTAQFFIVCHVENFPLVFMSYDAPAKTSQDRTGFVKKPTIAANLELCINWHRFDLRPTVDCIKRS